MTKQEFIDFVEENLFDSIELNWDDFEFNKDVKNLEQKLHKWAELDTKIQRSLENEEVCLVGVQMTDMLHFEYSNWYNLQFDTEDKPVITLFITV